MKGRRSEDTAKRRLDDLCERSLVGSLEEAFAAGDVDASSVSSTSSRIARGSAQGQDTTTAYARWCSGCHPRYRTPRHRRTVPAWHDRSVKTTEALTIIDQAIAGIDEFDVAYGNAKDAEGTLFQKLWAESLQIEAAAVLPRLELARQIAAHIGAADLLVDAPADKRLYGSHPYEENRKALVVLQTRLAEQERMTSILEPTGPQLSTSSLHRTVWLAASNLFDGGHYRQAVQTAGQALESHLQTIAGPAASGQDLARLFATGGDGPRLHFSELNPDGKTYVSAREGAAALIRGSMMAVRNLVSHSEWRDPSEDEALEMLAVLSYVAHLVDRAELISGA